MVELSAKTAAEGLLPFKDKNASLSEVVLGHVTSLSPYGDASDLSTALQAAHGMAWPAANRATGKAGARCMWFGQDQAVLIGPAPDASLARHAAVVDQSDAWVALRLEGEKSAEVLARLVAVDLRPDVFKRGAAIRTQALHVGVSIRRDADGYVIMAFRSMAHTLVHEIKGAMAAVAARG